MDAKPPCTHNPGMWEVNVIEKHFSSRCTRCGDLLQRLTAIEALDSKVPAIKNFMRKGFNPLEY